MPLFHINIYFLLVNISLLIFIYLYNYLYKYFNNFRVSMYVSAAKTLVAPPSPTDTLCLWTKPQMKFTFL